MVLPYNAAAEENTQVTWCCCTGGSYRCSIAVTGADALWGLPPQSRWRNPSEDTSRCSKGYEEDEDEIDVGGYENNSSPHSSSDGGSVCMSPVDSNVVELEPPMDRLKTVMSAAARKRAAPNVASVAEGSKRIHTAPICSPDRVGSKPSATATFPMKTDCNRGTSFPEDASLLKKKDVPLLMPTDYGSECWLSPLGVTKHVPSEYLTAARLAEDDVFIKTEGGACCVTDRDVTTPSTSPTGSSEDKKVHCFGAESYVNEKRFYIRKDEVGPNMFGDINEGKMVRKTAQSPVLSVKDDIRKCHTVVTAGDSNFTCNEVGCCQTARIGTREHGSKPTATDTSLPRNGSTPVNVHAADSSVLVENSHSIELCERRGKQESFIIKCPQNGDKHSLCDQQSSPVPRSTVTNYTQIFCKQSFEERSSSTQEGYRDESKTQPDSNRPAEDRGESPRNSLEDDVTDTGKQPLFVTRHFLRDGFPGATDKPVADGTVFVHGSDYARRQSLVVKLNQAGDQQRLEDKGGLLQSTSCIETHSQIDEKQCLENEVGTERNFTPEKGTQVTDLQRHQGHGESPVNGVTQRTLDDQSVCIERRSVLVLPRALAPEEGQTVIHHVGTARGRGVQEQQPFSPEDTALRCRVLALLWVLLGERRLREVGFPREPVHRILWRVVDVCCSVAGVKSAAAVPLQADHDCGLDMLCFRDHTHRFLEVCAPTREHWKQFGWASLTVDAVVRKIYDEGELQSFSMTVLLR
jgi:hypothetical protein